MEALKEFKSHNPIKPRCHKAQQNAQKSIPDKLI
jgi:hypothetical protein